MSSLPKGKARYEASVEAMNRNAVAGRGQIHLPVVPPNWYDVELCAPTIPALDPAADANLNQLGWYDNQHHLTLIGNPGGVPFYQNYVHGAGKAIICPSNDKREDVYNDATDQIYLSDLRAVACSLVSVAAGRDGNMRGLEAVWHWYIRNEETADLIKEIFAARRFRNSQWVEVAAGSDGFFALLYTANGKGVVRMLATYPLMFDRRMVARARLLPRFDAKGLVEGWPDLVWYIDQLTPTPIPPPAPAPAPRTHTRNHCVEEGKKSL